LRMSNTQMGSAAAPELAALRWGAARPVRLAQELRARAAEPPEPERQRLIDALTESRGRESA
jgi:hypothetical protein